MAGGFAFFGVPFLLIAQPDFRQRIETIREQYKGATEIEVIMDISVFERKGDQEPIYQERAIVKKSQDKYFYHLSGLEMLMNEKYLVLINEKQRLITCSRRDKESEMELSNAIPVSLDSLLRFYGTPRFIDAQNGVEHFSVAHGDGDIKQSDLFIEVLSGALKKIEYRYEGGQFAVIDFLRFSRSPDFTPDEFAEQKYFSENGGVLRLSDNYSRFRLTMQ